MKNKNKNHKKLKSPYKISGRVAALLATGGVMTAALVFVYTPFSSYFGLTPKAADAAANAPYVDLTYERLFTRTGSGWTSGDGGYSQRLPDGRDLWMFGDSMVSGQFVLGNTAVTTKNARSFTTISPQPFAKPNQAGSWYWLGDSVVENPSRMRVLASRMIKTGDGMWDFKQVGTDVVTVSLPSLKVTSKVQKTAGTVSWGSAIHETRDYLYIYGTEHAGWDKFAHVARVRTNQGLTGQWQYWTGDWRWSANESDSKRMLSGVSASYSVLWKNGTHYLITQKDFFDSRVVVRKGSSPAGPWGPEKVIYTTPSYGEGNFTYNALAHPQFPGDLLISYSVNGEKFDPATYRTHYVRVPWSILSTP